MLVDRSLQLTFRTYSTLFLCVAALTVPAHLAYSATFRQVIAVADLHGDIEEFPGLRQVRGVGRDDLATARKAGWGLALAEVLALPLLLRATRRVLAKDTSGHVPEATDAWLYALRLRSGDPPGPLRGRDSGARERLTVVAGGALVALAVGLLAQQLAGLLGDPISAERAWISAGLGEALARAAAAPFVLVALVVAKPLPKASARTAEG